MKTLIASDGSAEAMTAVRTASRLFRKADNDIHVLCVAPEFDWRPGPHENGKAREKRRRLREEYSRRIARETASILEQARKSFAADGIQVTTHSRMGSPSDVIIELASEYDVTVVGAKGRYDGSELGLGPVASRVVEYAAGLVLVGRPLASESSFRILVAVDGSEASRQALDAINEYFDASTAEITLLHVVETPWVHLGLDREWFGYSEEGSEESASDSQFARELNLEGNEVIEDARARLAEYNYSVLTVIQEGNPATEILGEAERGEYDVIVIGATGVTDAKHRVVGSVSAKVAWQANCSVAVVKATA